MTRGGLVIGGIALLAVGAGKLATTSGDVATAAAVVAWLVGGVLIHDLVVAPLALALAAGGRRWLPPSWQRGAIVMLVIVGSMSVWALPVLTGLGARPDNPTLLDRNYAAGWLIVAALALVASVVLVVSGVSDRAGGGRSGDGTRARRR